jgi:hypothetical protein
MHTPSDDSVVQSRVHIISKDSGRFGNANIWDYVRMAGR